MQTINISNHKTNDIHTLTPKYWHDLLLQNTYRYQSLEAKQSINEFKHFQSIKRSEPTIIKYQGNLDNSCQNRNSLIAKSHQKTEPKCLSQRSNRQKNGNIKINVKLFMKDNESKKSIKWQGLGSKTARHLQRKQAEVVCSSIRGKGLEIEDIIMNTTFYRGRDKPESSKNKLIKLKRN